MTDQKLDRRKALKAFGAAGIAGFAGCLGDDDGGNGGGNGTGGGTGTGTGTGDGQETIRAAWVYNSEVGDLGWSWAHDQGRQAVEEEFDWVETAYSEGRATAEEGREAMRQYTEEGYDVIFGCTFEYMDPMLELAQNNPDTIYEHCSGYETHDNMGRYFGRIYEARYLAGVAAGMMTEEDSLGYVAAFAIPEVVRGINAFTRGARSVNDEVTTKVRWTNTWFDPPTEREAAESLVDEGVDVMAQHQDSPAAVRAARDADIWATGYDAPMQEFGEDRYITSPIWHWGEYYVPTVEEVANDEWESGAYWEGLGAGIVDISDWGPKVPQEVKDEVANTRSGIESGDINVWADTQYADADDETLFGGMDSYVEGVEGSVPDS